MKGRQSDIPSISMLVAFEAAARLGGVNLAADELGVAPSAISRNIGNLEATVQSKLYVRKGRGITLTESGRSYLDSVQAAIQILRVAGRTLNKQKITLTITCKQDLSVMLLPQIYSPLKKSLGERVDLRIVSCEHDMTSENLATDIDFHFGKESAETYKEAIRILDEEVVPMASPDFVKRFDLQLSGHPRHWTGIPRLAGIAPADCWVTWSHWFDWHGCEPPEAAVEEFENYFYLAEAAVNGQGIALGWNGYVNSYFASGRLIPIRENWQKTKTGLYAVVTTKGRQNPNVRKFLVEFLSLVREVTDGSTTLKAACRDGGVELSAAAAVAGVTAGEKLFRSVEVSSPRTRRRGSDGAKPFPAPQRGRLLAGKPSLPT